MNLFRVRHRYVKEKLKQGHDKEKVIEEGATTTKLRSANTVADDKEIGSVECTSARQPMRLH